MVTPSAFTEASQVTSQAELTEELRRAEDDFARGDFVEITLEELERCAAAGEWPWRHESSE